MATLFIGIDPGVKTGVCNYSKGKITELLTLNFWETVDYLARLGSIQKQDAQTDPFKLKVVIEDPNFNKPIFEDSKFFRDLRTLANSGNWQKLEEAVKSRGKQGQNIGSNKREAQLLIEYCKRQNIEVTQRPPVKGHLAKMDAVKFELITGYKKRSSQHARDAAGLVFGL